MPGVLSVVPVAVPSSILVTGAPLAARTTGTAAEGGQGTAMLAIIVAVASSVVLGAVVAIMLLWRRSSLHRLPKQPTQMSNEPTPQESKLHTQNSAAV